MKEREGNIVLFREMVLGESFLERPQNDINQALMILSGAEAVIESRQLKES
ncbi:MAG: hypothetical protein AB2L14_09960 [Candidatus Xenobiia bacterium LiM19]